jgi:hypothetical protein
MRRTGRRPPERIDPLDLALLAIATHKLARLIAKSRVTSAVRAPFTHFQADAGPGEVDEEARGRGLQRAIGELLICPYCLSMWISGAFTAGLLTAPRLTRWVATVVAIDAGAELLNAAHARSGL